MSDSKLAFVSLTRYGLPLIVYRLKSYRECMRTRSNFYPSNSTANIPRRSNRRRIRNIVEPEIQTITVIVPIADRTMKELLQEPTEGYGEAIVILEILAENFEIKTNLLQLVQANKFHGRENDNPHTRISNFKRMTTTLKYKDVPNDAIKLMLFSYSLEDKARICKTDDRIDKLADQITNLVEIVNKQVIAPAKAVEKTCVTYGGDHAYYECIATDSTLSSNTVPNPKGEMNAVTTRSSLTYEGLSIPTSSPLEKVDEQNTEEILDKEHSNSSGSTVQVQPPVVPISIPEPDDKRFELAKVPLNENCSDMLWKKLPEKLGDPELTPTRMTLELADRSITHPKGVVEDVSVKVGKFHFPTDFVVVDFEANPRVPLILGRSFLRTGHALIDVYGEEITLRVNDESITFNLNQTIRYSLTYDDTTVNQVDVIDIACDDFVQDVLDFHYNPKSSSPTLVSDALVSESDSSKEPIVKSSSPTLTPFGESDFYLEEIEDFLNDDSIPMEIKNYVFDPKGDILFIENLLNEDSCQLPPMDLKLAEESKEKSSIEEPPELELKELPYHLEYAFLEDSNKLSVIIAKNPKVDEREALINVLKSHKRAIA
nr:reverse transcriptase domain-containing protein [Tanacetum cinerariifolium]